MYRILSVLTILSVISIIPSVLADGPSTDLRPLEDFGFTIPDWIKNNAEWWATDQIPDSAFLDGMEYLINEGIIIVEIPASIDSDTEEIPGWIKNTAGWWAEDKIHDVTFVSAIKYLISVGIIIIEQEVKEVEEPVEEVEEIKEFHMIVNDCHLCVNWGYTGEKYHIQINTFDEYRGNSLDGVTINAKIISKDGELRHNFGVLTTEDGIYSSYITIPSIEWFGDNILSVTGEYHGIEKTIEKEFTVFLKKGGGAGITQTGANDCGLVSPVDIGTDDRSPQDIVFSNDGRKMIVADRTENKIYDYTLTGGPYCIATASLSFTFIITEQEINVGGIAFNFDGTRMFVIGFAGDDVNIYKLTEAYDLSTASFVEAIILDTKDNIPESITFDHTGMKMFITGNNNDVVRQYQLTEPFGVSTQSFVYALDISGKDNTPTGLQFNFDGTKMFLSGGQNDKIYEYKLTEPYTISTASFVTGLAISGETMPRGFWFDPTGKTMYVVGMQGDDVNAFKLTEPFSLASASQVT